MRVSKLASSGHRTEYWTLKSGFFFACLDKSLGPVQPMVAIIWQLVVDLVQGFCKHPPLSRLGSADLAGARARSGRSSRFMWGQTGMALKSQDDKPGVSTRLHQRREGEEILDCRTTRGSRLVFISNNMASESQNGSCRCTGTQLPRCSGTHVANISK